MPVVDPITAETRARAQESREACKRPGKFEGEAPYVAFLWWQGLEGFADRDDGECYGFDVTPEDKALFPELRRRRTVTLRETSDGFVCEVRA